jgi:3-oxoadipate enol-lactonase
MSRIEVRSGAAALSARVDGEAGRPWLVLSNSLAADLSMWDDQIVLLTRTHRVVRYDTRGHGASSAQGGAYDFDMLVGDMSAVLDAVGAERADVLGLSLGGMTAMGFALAHPKRVGRIAVCDARADAPPPFVAGWDERIAAVRAGGMAAIVDGTLARWFTPACPPDVLARARAMILGTSVEGYVGCAEALKRLDYLRRLPGLARPALFVVGEDDMGAPKDAMARMAAATPNGEFRVLPGLAHVPNMENPHAFAAAVGPWFAAAVEEGRAA